MSLKSINELFSAACFKAIPELVIISRYRRSFGRMPNLINPKTFNEKLVRKIIFDRNPKLTLFTDKLLVRDFVKSRLGKDGEKYLTKIYAVIDTPDEIRGLNLPDQFVMKPNHLSDAIKIVHNFKELECGSLEKLAAAWLQMNYYYKYGEWAYKNIKPHIIFEELLEFEGKIADDYKFYCFNGNPQFIAIHKNRFAEHRRNFYDLNLNLLPVKLTCENFQEDVRAPENFDKMIEIAKKLSAGIDLIRVDLYNINGRIIFGELTVYPCGGIGRFEPSSWDIKFGSYLK